MNKQQWYEKICEWVKRKDSQIYRLPFIFYDPLAELLAQHDATKQSAASDPPSDLVNTDDLDGRFGE